MEVENIEKMFLISPNLGHPSILQIDRKLKKKKFQASLLFISDTSDPDNFRDLIYNKLSLVPLFDYKWSYKLILVKKPKGLFSKWRKRRARKKRMKFFEDKDVDLTEADLNLEKLKKLKSQLHRGKPVFPKIINIESISIIPIQNISNINNLNPQEFLIKNQVFGEISKFYKVDIEFSLNKKVLEFLKERNFVMFDIHCPNNRINYHSLVISKQRWNDFIFIHATDLHLAERNDRLYEIIKKWTVSSITKSVEDFFETDKKKLKIKKKKKSQSGVFY
ncbi:MAG: hypothetical protein ACFFDH_22890, partial [Promethearchaeota archaeon]